MLKQSLGVAVLALTATAVVSGPAVAATPGAIETWDNDVAGWTGNTTSSTVVHTPNGGNPGGHILTRKSLSPPVFDIGALTDSNPDFTGDYAAAGVGQVSFDVQAQNNDLDDIWVRFRSGAAVNGWRYSFGAQTQDANSWTSHSVLFDATWTDAQAKLAGWLEDRDVDPQAPPSISWAATMGNVVTAEVRLASTGSTIAGIDNFALGVPEPGMLTLLALGGVVLLGQRRALG